MNSHFDMSDAEGQDLGHDECARCGKSITKRENMPVFCAMCDEGTEMPAYCALCDNPPEYCICHEKEDTMQDPDKMMEPPPEPFDWNTRLNLLLDEATDLEIKTAGYALDRVKAKRLEAAHQRIRDLDPNAPRPRARRSDADKPRAPKAVKNP